MSGTVGAGGVTDGGGPNPLAGLAIVGAASMGAAPEIAGTCPLIGMGAIEVAEAMDLQRPKPEVDPRASTG